MFERLSTYVGPIRKSHVGEITRAYKFGPIFVNFVHYFNGITLHEVEISLTKRQ
jgi:hypothetical protein